MKKPDKLTPLEWEVMNTVWNFKKYPITVRQVLERAYPKGEKAYTTVQTIMNHLMDKGFLLRKKIGPVNVYSPNITASKFQKKEIHRFVDKAFNGSFFSLANFLVNSGRLTSDELTKLQEMLNQNNGD